MSKPTLEISFNTNAMLLEIVKNENKAPMIDFMPSEFVEKLIEDYYIKMKRDFEK